MPLILAAMSDFPSAARDIRNVLTKRVGQINLVFLFLTQNFADVLGNPVLAERLALASLRSEP